MLHPLRNAFATLVPIPLLALLAGCSVASSTTTDPTGKKTDPQQTSTQQASNTDDGCAGNTALDQAPVTFPAGATVAATHTSETCGADPSSFRSGDLYSLSITAPSGDAFPPANVTVTFNGSVATNQSIPLVLQATTGLTASQTAQGTGAEEVVSLLYAEGAVSQAIDATPLQAAIVEVLALPAAHGDPLSVALTLEFQDGRELVQNFSALVTTDANMCTSGAEDAGAAH